MFEFFERCECPSCRNKMAPVTVKVSRYHAIKVFNCPQCKADFVKNKRAELYPVLEEGVVLC
jgi:transposase-like protein